MKKEKQLLTIDELVLIEDHCGKLLASAESMVSRLTAIVSRTGDKASTLQLAYWKNYRSAMRQAITTARQRAGVSVNGQ